MSVWIEDKMRELKSVLEMWDFFVGKNETQSMSAEECKKHYGTWTDDDGEKHIIQDSAMMSVIEFMEVVKKWAKDVERNQDRERWDLKRARQDIEYWKERACMSDAAVSELLTDYIAWAERNDNEENLQYTDVKLLEIARGRLKR